MDQKSPHYDDKIALGELKNDDTDNLGVVFVETSDVGIASDYGVKTLPAMIYSKNGEPRV